MPPQEAGIQGLNTGPAAGEGVGAPDLSLGAGILSQFQMRTNLQDLFSKVQSKYQQLNSKKISSDNQNESTRQEVIKVALDILQSAGVDPSNPEELKAFMDDLAEKNPDMYELLSYALDGIFNEGGEEVPPPDLSIGGANMAGMNVSQNEMTNNMNTPPDAAITPNI